MDTSLGKTGPVGLVDGNSVKRRAGLCLPAFVSYLTDDRPVHSQFRSENLNVLLF